MSDCKSALAPPPLVQLHRVHPAYCVLWSFLRVLVGSRSKVSKKKAKAYVELWRDFPIKSLK